MMILDRLRPIKKLMVLAILIMTSVSHIGLCAEDDLAKAWKKVADDAWKKAWEKVEEEVYATIEDDPSLPRVLLIGDSISMVYTGQVRHLLRGRVNVHHPPMNCGSTIRGLEDLSEWLGNKKWDVIHFNWGLHDLVVMADGSNRVPLEQYKINLVALVQKLKKTEAKLIWATTTPIPERIEGGGPTRRRADAVAYNAVAFQIMEGQGIPVNDLYTTALSQLKEIQIPFDVHFTFEGSEILAKQVADAILGVLRQAARPRRAPCN